jgi:hypothetical protein
MSFFDPDLNTVLIGIVVGWLIRIEYNFGYIRGILAHDKR